MLAAWRPKIARGRWFLLLAGLLLVNVIGAPAAVEADVANYKVLVDGQEVQFLEPPLARDGHILVPYRPFFRALGTTAEWDQRQQVVRVVKGDKEIFLKPDQTQATINGKETVVAVPPRVIADRLYVPVRLMAEMLDWKVEWDAKQRAVLVNSPAPPPPAAPPREVILEEDTRLEFRPGQAAVFAAGSTALLSGEGLVLRGVIKGDTLLPYRGKSSILVKGGTAVEFNTSGSLSSGVIKNELELPYGPDGRLLWVKDNCPVAFHPDGRLKSGTLLRDAELNYGPTATATFRARSEVDLSREGRVLRGTLKNDTSLRFSQFYLPDGNQSPLGDLSEVFQRDTVVEFYEHGQVKSGVVVEEATFPYASGKWLKVKEEEPVGFFPDGYLEYGTLLEKGVFTNGRGQNFPLIQETVVRFHPGGALKQGVVNTDMVLNPDAAGSITLLKGQTITFDEIGNCLNS